MSALGNERSCNNSTDDNFDDEKALSIPEDAAQPYATGQASKNALADPEIEEDEDESTDEESPSDAGATRVYTLTETWLLIPPDDVVEVNSVGVQILGIFWDLNGANTYAQRHVEKLERLTKAPREIDDSRELETGFISIDPDEDDPFSGRWQKTKPVQEYEDGTKRFQVLWGNRSTNIDVERKSVYDSVGTAPSKKPLHDSTIAQWITRPSFWQWSEDNSLLWKRPSYR